MLIELIRPAGAELARRWLAALMIAPEDERPGIVDEIESTMVSLYRSGRGVSPADDAGVGRSGLERTPMEPRHELRGMATSVESAERAAMDAAFRKQAQARKAKKKSAKKPAQNSATSSHGKRGRSGGG
jgi:hypothetical protein